MKLLVLLLFQFFSLKNDAQTHVQYDSLKKIAIKNKDRISSSIDTAFIVKLSATQSEWLTHVEIRLYFDANKILVMTERIFPNKNRFALYYFINKDTIISEWDNGNGENGTWLYLNATKNNFKSSGDPIIEPLVNFLKRSKYLQ